MNTPCKEHSDEHSRPGQISTPTIPADLSVVPERDWEKLLTLMKEGNIVPVIGPELLCVPWGADPAVRLYDIWGEVLAECRNITIASESEGAPLLYRVASCASMVSGIPQGDLEYDMDSVIRCREWPLPESLRLLAEIRDFPLYVTTTIDHLMERALREVSGSQKVPLQISFNPGGNRALIDLPLDFQSARRDTVFHLFGATSTDTEGYAATEDELIEFSWSLIDHDYAPKRLYDFLRKKTILLLGCNFPDWLARFFIHALTRRSDSHIAVTYVSACPECGLRDFLKRRKARLIPPVSPIDFVIELHRRWKEQQHVPPAETVQPVPLSLQRPAKKGSVFLSYCRDDRQTAVAIRAQLDAAGIDVWMDETGLEPGAVFREVIHTSIENASFFIALISRSLDLSESDRPGRFVYKEWKWAEEVNEERPPNMSFLLPVAIDDTPSNAPFLCRSFREANWTYFRDDLLPAQFISFLQDGIRRFRSKPGEYMP